MTEAARSKDQERSRLWLLAVPVIYTFGAPTLAGLILAALGLLISAVTGGPISTSDLVGSLQSILIIYFVEPWMYPVGGIVYALAALILPWTFRTALLIHCAMAVVWLPLMGFEVSNHWTASDSLRGVLVLFFLVSTMICWWLWRRAPALTLIGSVAAAGAFFAALSVFQEEVSHFTWF